MLSKLKLTSWVIIQVLLGRQHFLYYYVRVRRTESVKLIGTNMGRTCLKFDIFKVPNIVGYYNAILSTHGKELKHIWVKSYTNSKNDSSIERKNTITILGDIDLPLDIILEQDIKTFVEENQKGALKC